MIDGIAPATEGRISDATDASSHRLLRDIRRDLHRMPELRFSETLTSDYIAATVTPLSDRVTRGVAKTGLIAEIDSGRPGPRVLLRADMDAYPVQEANDVEYRSRHDGVSHACGHDAHMTVVAGVLRRFAATRPERGSVHALFQPAEEIPFGQPSGAQTVLDEGALPGPYDAVIGLHCWPQLEAGQVGVDTRIAMAAKDAFSIVVHGVGAHAATPVLGRDALLAMSDLVTAMHSLMARRRNPNEMIALNVGTIVGGASQSLVPQTVSITGTLRTHEQTVRERSRQVIDQLCRGHALSHDVRIELEWADAMPSLMNDASLVSLARHVGPQAADIVELTNPPLTTDDFALLAERWPGIYLKLGVAAPGRAGSSSLHSPSFDIDERCLDTGVNMMERLTRAVLSGEGSR